MGIRKTFLNALFLSSALWMGRPAHAQQNPPGFTPPFMMPDMAKMIPPQPEKSEMQAVPRVGLLYIRGPESDTSKYKMEAQIESINFKKRFKSCPVRTIGNGIDSVGIDGILHELDELAKEDVDAIVMVNFMHGGPQYRFGKIDSADGKKYLPFYASNDLRYKSDESGFSADSLYKAVGMRFQSNKKLRDKNLILLHQACHGETALRAFHYLPAGTQVFYYSSVADGVFYEPGDNAFSVAFEKMQNTAKEQKRPAPEMNIKTAFVTGFMAANAPLKTKHNDMRYLVILDEKADTARVLNEKFYFGAHQGAVIRPEEALARIAKDFSDTQIQLDLAEYDAVISKEERQSALDAYRNNIWPEWMAKADVKNQDCLNFIAVAMALKHDGYFRKSLDYGLGSDVKAAGCWVPRIRVTEDPPACR